MSSLAPSSLELAAEARKARLARFGNSGNDDDVSEAPAAAPVATAPVAAQQQRSKDDSAPADAVPDEGDGFEHDELECPICLRLLHEPIATSCGHTFCRVCLAQSLRSKAACPVCRVPAGPAAASGAPNRVISAIIRKRFPQLRADRDAEAAEERRRQAAAPLRLPLFFLPDLLPFPGTPVELRVFEPRYLLMVQRLLDGEGGGGGGARNFGMVRCGEPGATGAIGVMLTIENVQRPPFGARMHMPSLLVSTRAEQRFRIVDPAPSVEEDTRGLTYAHVRLFSDDDADNSNGRGGDVGGNGAQRADEAATAAAPAGAGTGEAAVDGNAAVAGLDMPLTDAELQRARERVSAAAAKLTGPQASELRARFGTAAPSATAEQLSLWLAAAVPAPFASRAEMLEMTNTARRLRAALAFGEARARKENARLHARPEGEDDADPLPLSFDLFTARGPLLPFQVSAQQERAPTPTHIPFSFRSPHTTPLCATFSSLLPIRPGRGRLAHAFRRHYPGHPRETRVLSRDISKNAVWLCSPLLFPPKSLYDT
jgi:Lon protease-like protein